jgi:hypothetical protein
MPSAAKGAASPWFEVRAQKPADGESEPNYWLGYASGPRTDQHPPRYFLVTPPAQPPSRSRGEIAFHLGVVK